MNNCGFLSAQQARTFTRDNMRVYAEICGIQQAILSAVDQGEYSVTVKDSTPMTRVSGIESVTVISGGIGYVTVSAQAEVITNTGTGALLQPVVSGQSITSIQIVGGGTGYLPGDFVEIVHPTGFGFAGTLTVTNGVITGATVVEGGNLYNDLPPVAVITDATGTGAVLSVNADQNGVITSIDVTQSGSGYSPDATVTITPALGTSGASAQALAVVQPEVTGFNSTDYNSVLIGQSSNQAIEDQLQAVHTHFGRLGYALRAQTNPDTGNTLQWLVSW